MNAIGISFVLGQPVKSGQAIIQSIGSHGELFGNIGQRADHGKTNAMKYLPFGRFSLKMPLFALIIHEFPQVGFHTLGQSHKIASGNGFLESRTGVFIVQFAVLLGFFQLKNIFDKQLQTNLLIFSV